MWGLFPAGQHELEAPYKAKILAHIPKLNEGSDLGLLESFAGSMLPTQCTPESEAELAQLIKDYSGMKPQVLKSVKSSHQQIGRCVKALTLLK